MPAAQAMQRIEGALRTGFWLPWDAAQLDARLEMAQQAMALARRGGNRERPPDGAHYSASMC